jgi:hypothetical protein
MGAKPKSREIRAQRETERSFAIRAISFSDRPSKRQPLQSSVRTFRGMRHPFHVRSWGCRWQFVRILVENFDGLDERQ